ncbi:hypothetical protein RhiJN_10468 [Ceratobasidium sp. AG-Ba]|nr:hypothetical protein RhiJN_10468 [Ceratobasidium sp. AG-Ba]QRW11199.1 hypothetical protein RhiLY_10198 [Ceratobasidium sp. AG-Ba]
MSSEIQIQRLAAAGNYRLGIQTGVKDLRKHENMLSALLNAEPSQWVQTKITRVIPVFDLLKRDLKAAVDELYSTLLSHQPESLDGIGGFGGVFDGTEHAFGVISSVTILSDGLIHGISVRYQNGTQSGRYGGPSQAKQVFKLRSGNNVRFVEFYELLHLTLL